MSGDDKGRVYPCPAKATAWVLRQSCIRASSPCLSPTEAVRIGVRLLKWQSCLMRRMRHPSWTVGTPGCRSEDEERAYHIVRLRRLSHPLRRQTPFSPDRPIIVRLSRTERVSSS